VAGRSLLPWNPDANGKVRALALSADGTKLYVGGNFIDMGCQGGMVVLDGVTGAAVPQQWSVDRPVHDLTVWPGDGTTVFAATGGPGGRLFAYRPSVPSRPLWKAAVDGDAMGVAATPTGPYTAAVGDDRVFIGGEFNRINGAAHPGYAQFALPPSMPPATTASSVPSSSSPTTTPTVKPQAATSSTTATTAKPTTTTKPPASTTTTTGKSLLGSLFG